MIIWISGVGAVGKSTVTHMIKDKLKKHYSNMYEGDNPFFSSKNGYKIPFSTYGGKVMVIGRSGKQVMYGSDGVTIGLSKFQDFLHYECFKWKPVFSPHLIIEGHKFISKDAMHDYLIEKNIDYKMYYLTAPRDIIDKRSKERANGWDNRIRTDKLITNQLESYSELTLKYKDNVVIRQSETTKQQESISDEIFNDLKL